MWSHGPKVEVALVHPETLLEIPNMRAVIDTGSPWTLVQPDAIANLQLPEVVPKKTAMLHGIGAKSKEEPLHAARLTFVGMDLPTIPVEVAPADLRASDKTLDMLIGRDVLERYTLVYDGPTKTVTLIEP